MMVITARFYVSEVVLLVQDMYSRRLKFCVLSRMMLNAKKNVAVNEL